MSDIIKISENLKNGKYDDSLNSLYGSEAENNCCRYLKLSEDYKKYFSNKYEVNLFSAPGRTEIIGNHTDHQNGCVIAQAVNLDIAAVVSKNDEDIIRITSFGYKPNEVSLLKLDYVESEKETSEALIRGIAAEFSKRGYKIGGFDAVTDSAVPGGSGLSSSAAFEVLIGTILNSYYNNNKINPVEIAKIGQAAENKYFGKPSGLMDQMACAVGGLNFMDFKVQAEPVIEPIDFDFNKSDYNLCIVNTGGSHADLTGEYTAIPNEMKAVANELGANCMREADQAELYEKIPGLRKKYGDRAIVRAMNFIEENNRAEKAFEALGAGDIQAFKRLILQSGNGSFMYLQNVIPGKEIFNQGLVLALMISEHILKGRGAWRVHGGGFAGTIQAFVPKDMKDDYKKIIESVFSPGSCNYISARAYGGFELVENQDKI